MTNTQVELPGDPMTRRDFISELDLLWKQIATLKDSVNFLNDAITKSIEIHTKRIDSHHRLLTDLVVDIGMLKERS